MIPKIHASYNVTEVYVTSDHGFLFNDIVFAEKDKHKIEEETLERSSRYYLTTSNKEVNGIIKFPLDEVSAMVNVGDVFVQPCHKEPIDWQDHQVDICSHMVEPLCRNSSSL